MALYQRSSRWFGLPACTANPKGQPPSLAQHRFVAATCYVASTLLSWTHELRTVFTAFLLHLPPSIPDRTLLGPLSGIEEARQAGGAVPALEHLVGVPGVGVEPGQGGVL